MGQPRDEEPENFEQFRDAFSTVLIEKVPKSQPKPPRKRSKKAGAARTTAVKTELNEGPDAQGTDAEELADFVDYIAEEAFAGLPSELRSLNHRTWAEDSVLRERYDPPLTSFQTADLLPALDPAVSDSLTTYGILDPAQQSIADFLAPILSVYVAGVSAPPPAPSTTRGQVTACEICGRDWVPLTYHHLIPRFVHAKVLKRGWHREDELQNVAWLCRACHSFVHHFAGHEELAREYHTVELLLEQDEVRAFAKWVGRVRWKAGRTKTGRG